MPVTASGSFFDSFARSMPEHVVRAVGGVWRGRRGRRETDASVVRFRKCTWRRNGFSSSRTGHSRIHGVKADEDCVRAFKNGRVPAGRTSLVICSSTPSGRRRTRSSEPCTQSRCSVFITMSDTMLTGNPGTYQTSFKLKATLPQTIRHPQNDVLSGTCQPGALRAAQESAGEDHDTSAGGRPRRAKCPAARGRTGSAIPTRRCLGKKVSCCPAASGRGSGASDEVRGAGAKRAAHELVVVGLVELARQHQLLRMPHAGDLRPKRHVSEVEVCEGLGRALSPLALTSQSGRSRGARARQTGCPCSSRE